MSEIVLAVQAQCFNLVNTDNWSALSSPFIGVYESPVSSSFDNNAFLQLKDAIQQLSPDEAVDDNAAAAFNSNSSQNCLFIQSSGAELPGAPKRVLHFRVYEPATPPPFSEPNPNDPPLPFQLLGAAAVPYDQLMEAYKNKRTLDVTLLSPLSPLSNQTLRKFNSRLQLNVRAATDAESTQERAFEKGLELLHSEVFEGLPKDVNNEEIAHKQAMQLFLSSKQLPSVESEEQDAVLLAALFEKDLRSGNMKLQGMTPWTRSSADSYALLRFPGSLSVDYFSGEQQLFQLSLYRLGLDASSIAVPREFVLKEENRIGSVDFLLDYFGLESNYFAQQWKRANSAVSGDELKLTPVPAAIGTLYTTPAHPRVLHLDLQLTHDVNSNIDAELKASQSILTVSLDSSKYSLTRNPKLEVASEAPAAAPRRVTTPKKPVKAPSAAPSPNRVETPSAPVSANVIGTPPAAAGAAAVSSTSSPAAAASPALDEKEIERTNQEQLNKALQLLTVASSATSSTAAAIEKPVDAVPDAEDVDVSGVDEASVDLTNRLLQMMEEGQTFILHELGAAPKRQKLFYRNPHSPSDRLPGFLYLCDVTVRPSTVDVATVQGLDLCTVSDIYLGQQAPAFHPNGVPSANADDDDTLSFSLVTANSVSLNVEALSAKQRAAWLLGIMGTLQQAEEPIQ